MSSVLAPIDAHARQIRGKRGALMRHSPERVDEIEELDRDFREARILAFIREQTAATPTLRPEQWERIIAVINSLTQAVE